MQIGVLKEIMLDEYRVALTPAGARELISRGHSVLVQSGAGLGSSFADEAYEAAGAVLVPRAEDVFLGAELILKVKEPVEDEYLHLGVHHVLISFLHLAPNPHLTQGLAESGATALAYETVESENGYLPLLAPMSKVAGRLSVHAGAHLLEKASGGKGKLLGGVPGVPAAKVVILGGGIAGANAATIAAGMRARVTVLELDTERLRGIERYLPEVETLISNQTSIEEQVVAADLLIGAVLVPGAKAPTLVSEELVKEMQPGSVIVDISIDQGGCIATSRPTTHSKPTFIRHGVVHYCVTNMPGIVPITSTLALTNVTLPYIMKIADRGLHSAVREDKALEKGINVMEGKVTNRYVADATGYQYFHLESLIPIEYA